MTSEWANNGVIQQWEMLMAGGMGYRRIRTIVKIPARTGVKSKWPESASEKIRITEWPKSASGKGTTTNGRTVPGAVKEGSKQTCVGCQLILQ